MINITYAISLCSQNRENLLHMKTIEQQKIDLEKHKLIMEDFAKGLYTREETRHRLAILEGMVIPEPPQKRRRTQKRRWTHSPVRYSSPEWEHLIDRQLLKVNLHRRQTKTCM